ncbi:MAG: hypothetical protein AAF585_15170, partial [Verrucomicrobiota bacterium]
SRANVAAEFARDLSGRISPFNRIPRPEGLGFVRATFQAACFVAAASVAFAQTSPNEGKPLTPITDEEKYYKLVAYELPPDLKLEASGLAVLPEGKLAVSIRKGEVWIAQDPMKQKPEFKRFAHALHEPIGLAWRDGALYTTQRSEVTKMRDVDGDGVADEYLTAAKGWGVSGNYHEYAYGPAFDAEGNLWVTLNQTLGKPVKMNGVRDTEFPWRGWSMMKPAAGGPMQPMSAGLRSPFGIAANHEGEIFATDQQGNWWGTNPLMHLKRGVFHGHADALRDVERPESPVKHPGELPKGISVAQAIEQLPGYEPPAVWFPYNKIGASTTGLVYDSTGGKFGPFENQFFVGEFTYAFVSRVFLEKVGGQYQGACFHFRRGMQSAVLSLAFLPNGDLVVGESNRGWNSIGTRSFGLERLVWTGEVPFEIKTMEARPKGFKLTFTKPVDPNTAQFQLLSYTYNYHSSYGSDEIDHADVNITAVNVAADGLSAELSCEGLRAGYVHELHADDVRSKDGLRLLHPEAYYTLNQIPES